MRPGSRLPVLLVVTTLLAAGCVGAKSAEPADATRPAIQEADADTAVINFLVTDDSLSPLEGAQVGATGFDETAMTDAGGRASIGGLQPGTYTAIAQKLGYESAAKKLQLIAGQALEVRLALVPLAVVEAHHLTHPFRGHITCGAGLIQIRLITVCGTTGTGTAAGNVTVDPNHKDEFRQTGVPGLRGVVGELVWTSNAPLTAKEFTLALYQNWRCTPFCSSDNAYGSANGKSPVVHRAEGPFAGLKKAPATISHVVGLPGQSADPPFVIFVVQQDYTIYSTHFFGLPPPEGFTANPDG